MLDSVHTLGCNTSLNLPFLFYLTFKFLFQNFCSRQNKRLSVTNIKKKIEQYYYEWWRVNIADC